MIEAIAWPAVGLVLGLVALFIFRPAINRKIDRISRAGKDGVAFDRPQDPEPPKSEAVSYDQLMKQPISATVLAREKTIAERLATLPLSSDSERIALLTRAAASANVDLEFTRIANIIFGTQLNFLVQLAGTRSGLSRKHAEEAYAAAAAQYPEIYRERSFDDWIGYLGASGLLNASGQALDITQYGSDFLKYLVDARIAYDRLG